MSRRGFGLLELLIALTLTGAVAILVWTILSRAAFRLRDRSERMGMEHALRVATTATRATIESLGSDSTGGVDLASMAPDGLIARAVRGSGVVCAVSTAVVSVRLGADWWSALRAPVPLRDSLLIGTVVEPARWIALDLPLAPGTGTCPDGSPALTLPATIPPANFSAIGPGSPLRFFEPLEIRSYASSGALWLGVRGTTTAGAIQPISGPFAGAGVGFAFHSSTGAVALAPGSVGVIAVRTQGTTERSGGIGITGLAQPQADSSTQSVALRNAP